MSSDEQQNIYSLVDKIFQTMQENYELKNTVNELTKKLSAAGQKMVDILEWLDCLYIAMGDKKDKIVQTANLERRAIKKYKERRKGAL